jgi:hypothetical protein
MLHPEPLLLTYCFHARPPSQTEPWRQQQMLLLLLLWLLSAGAAGC